MFGRRVLLDTLALLDEAGIATAGAGPDLTAARTPALLTVDTAQGPVRFAFLGYDAIASWYAARDYYAGTAPLDEESLREDVAAALAVADHVVVGTSWGIEETADPTTSQIELGGIAVEAGATLVAGNHPHWVQAVEHFDGALVAYALGNFIFDQYDPVENTHGMLIELGFTADRLIGYRIRPLVIRAHNSVLRWPYRPEFVDPAGEGRPILDRVWGGAGPAATQVGGVGRRRPDRAPAARFFPARDRSGSAVRRPRGAQYGDSSCGNIGKCRTFCVQSRASRRSAVAAIT